MLMLALLKAPSGVWGEIGYSYLNDFTGFRLAALHVCELTVESATAVAITGPTRKAHNGIGV